MIATSALPTVSTELADLAGQLRASVVQVHAGDRGIGSGVVWHATTPDATGQSTLTVITNAHVVLAARGSTLAVKLLGGPQGHSANAPTDLDDNQRLLPATVLAVDPSHDLASLRVMAALGPTLQVAPIGDSTALRIGELVVAVGNPFGREGAMTVGVVAARAPVDLEESAEHADPIAPDAPEGESGNTDQQERQPGRAGRGGFGGQWRGRRRLETEVIQADIRLYPGNSGGPLADAAGRVVGINSMVVGGLGFAIPSRTVQAFLAQAQNATQRPHLGVELLTVPLSPAQQARIGTQQPTAILVTGVEPGSPAEAAGVLVGDLLLAVNAQSMAQAQQLPHALARIAAADAPLTLALLRGEGRIELRLTPELRAAA